MRDQGDRSTGNGGQQLHLRRKMGAGPIRQQSGHRHANKCMQSIPYHIEAGNFVGDEFHRKQNRADTNNCPAPEDFKPLRQYNPMRVRQQTKRQHGRINIEPGGETCRDNQGCDRTGSEGRHLLRILSEETLAVILYSSREDNGRRNAVCSHVQ